MRSRIDPFVAVHLRLSESLHPFVPEIVERAIPRGLKEVRLRRRPLRDVGAPLPQLQHHVLNDLLGYRARAHERFGCPDERRVPGAENGVERRLIPLPEALDQVVLVQAGYAEGWGEGSPTMAPSGTTPQFMGSIRERTRRGVPLDI